ncbi:Fic family protein [Orbaceae bacterium ESL0721]|nr:Fic family protein [Orbaceae bacterium ESL0721]
MVDYQEQKAILKANRFQGTIVAAAIIDELTKPCNLFSLDQLKNLHATIFNAFPTIWFDNDVAPFFEDLPSEYLAFSPGKYRNASSLYDPWMKQRHYKNGDIYTFYSCADIEDYAKVAKLLDNVDIKTLKHLNNEEKIDKLVAIYNEIDFLHPFQDGNSRTNRLFISKLASAIGIVIDWSLLTQEELFAARDINLLQKSKYYYRENSEVLAYIKSGIKFLEDHKTLDLKRLLLTKRAFKQTYYSKS